MSYAIHMPAGGGFLDIRSLSSVSDDTRSKPAREGETRPPRLSSNLPDPHADEPKWPAWKVTIAVIVFCSAFWAGIGYLVSRLFN